MDFQNNHIKAKFNYNIAEIYKLSSLSYNQIRNLVEVRFTTFSPTVNPIRREYYGTSQLLMILPVRNNIREGNYK